MKKEMLSISIIAFAVIILGLALYVQILIYGGNDFEGKVISAENCSSLGGEIVSADSNEISCNSSPQYLGKVEGVEKAYDCCK
jgi:hypothetical protein